MLCRYCIYGLVVTLSLLAVARTQPLKDDKNFPVLNELQWETSLDSTRKIFESRNILESSTDSIVVGRMNYFGFPTRVEIAFYRGSAGMRSVNVKFKNPTRAIEDTLVNHFTQLANRAPVRQTKEKSLLIMTLKMEIAIWKLSSGTVLLVTGKRNEEIFDLYLSLLPPSKEKG